jgi:putative ABC transport system ATP-binding protein
VDIIIRNLSKSFDGRTLWKNLNYNISAGKMTAITGKSGSGKTTLLNCIGLLENIDTGQVIFGENDVTRSSYRKKLKLFRHTIGFLFQNYGLISEWTVDKNLDIALEYSKIPKNRRTGDKLRILEYVGLKSKAHAKVYSLSGGEQQRVALAKLVLKEAKIILCDEPSAALDEDNANIVVSLLKDLAYKGCTVIISTHDKSVVSQCDETIEL